MIWIALMQANMLELSALYKCSVYRKVKDYSYVPVNGPEEATARVYLYDQFNWTVARDIRPGEFIS